MVQGAAAGAVLTLSEHNWGPGASGWLTWDGDSSAPALAASLVPPGNVASYVNPAAPADHELDVGDWVLSSPGHKWSRAVRDNLGALLGQDVVVPTFTDERLQGGQLQYRVARFVTIRIVGLTVQQSIRFEHRGPSACGTAAVVAADLSLQTAEETPLPVRLDATGPVGVPLTYLIVEGPAHGTLSGDAPALTYTPDAQYEGPDRFTYLAIAGGVQSGVATVSIVVTGANDPPVITSAPVLEVHDGEPYAYLASVEDLDAGDVLTWSLLDAPAGMTIDASTGAIAWLPAFADVGQHVVTVLVTDAAGATDSQTYTLRVVHPAPVAIDQRLTLDEDSSLAIGVLDAESARPLVFTVVTPPLHGVLSGAPPALLYTPYADHAGPDSFTFTASDGAVASNLATVTIDVTPVDDPPRITSHPVTAALDLEPYRYAVVAEDVDAGDVLTFRLPDAPAGMTIDPATGLVEWSPGVADLGDHPVAVEVMDLSGLTDRQDFVLTVLHPAPVAEDQLLTTDEDVPVAFTLGATSVLPLLFEIVEPPLRGALSGDGAERVYEPAADHHGVDRLTFRVTDGVAFSAIATVTLTVAPVNDPPRITSAPEPDAPEGAYAYQVTVADVDVDDGHTFGVLRAPGGMAIDGAGRLAWDTAGWAGNSRLPHTLCAAGGESTFGPPAAVEVVAIVDESNSMRGEHAWMADVGAPLEAHLVTNGVGVDAANGYGLAGFESEAHPIPVGGGDLGSHVDFIAATASLALDGGTEDGYRAIHQVLDRYPLREEAARNVILVTDEDRDVVDATLTYATTLAELTAARVMLNVVVDANFRCADGTVALGLGQDGIGYVADGQGGFVTCDGVTATDPPREAVGTGFTPQETPVADYVTLALATGGAAWDLKVLRAGGLDAQSFTSAFLAIKVREILSQLPTRELPDAYVHSLRASREAVEVVVGNRGLTPLTGTTTALVHAGGALVGSVAVDDLAPGALHSFSLPWSPDPAEPPAQLLAAVVAPTAECSDANNQLAAAWVGVRATDLGGLFDQQDFSLQVVDRNDPPQITSAPVLTATVERRYRATVTAVDPDRGDGLAFSLAQAPVGMTIHPRLGVIDHVPDGAQEGTHDVEVVVRDLAGAEARQTFSLTVGTTGRPPRFASEPPWRVTQGAVYTYAPEVTADPGAALQFDAFLAPPGFEMDAVTGEIEWLAPADFAGKKARVLLRVRDGDGNYDLQQYVIHGDTANVAPRITSLAGLVAETGTTYEYAASATDPNHFEELTWRAVALPPGASLTPEATTFPATTARARLAWPAVAATSPSGMEGADPRCLTRDASVAPFAPRAVWTRAGIQDAGQAVVGPLADTNLDGQLSSADLLAVALVAGSATDVPSRALHVLDARTGARLWFHAQRPPAASVQPAIADLDGSAQATILFIDQQRHLVALRGNGTVRWVSAEPVATTELRFNAIQVSDLDGDGQAEILIGPAVYGADGGRRWAFPAAQFFERGEPLVLDVDGDGLREVLYRGELRNHHGLLLKRLYPAASAQPMYGFYAPVRLDGDPRLLFAASERTSQGYFLRLLDGDGGQVWSVAVAAAGPLLVHDVDGDGHDDLYSAALGSLYSAAGQLVWHTVSHATSAERFHSATLADLDGDAEWELLVARSGTFDVVAARTGALLWRHAGAGTDVTQTAPLVDLDGNGDATLFLVETQAVRAYRSARTPWASAAWVWHQRGFAAGEVGADLRPLPAVAGQASAPRNVVNQLGTVAQSTVFLPDLRLGGVSGDIDEAAPTSRLFFDVNNRGTAASRPATVEVYRDDVRLGQVAVPALAPHQKVSLPIWLASDQVGDGELRSVVVAGAGDTECTLTNNTGSSRVMAVAIEDVEGLEDTYRWAVRVDERVEAPVVSSTPPLAAVENVLYRHQVVATSLHADDVLAYRLVQAPDGASIDPLTGELSWTPRWGQVGQFGFVLNVTSLNGRVGGKSWVVTVARSTEPNAAPVFTSTAASYATVGLPYRYDAVAQDPDGQAVTYRLEVAPPGMAIDPVRGIVLWVPAAAADAAPVRIVATDERGATARQDLTLRVYAHVNRPPVVSSVPPRLVNVGGAYQYPVAAIDPDGDPLTYTWTAPADAVVAGGALAWQPGVAEAGEHQLAVEVRDDRGGSVRQAWTVFVNDPAQNAAPQISSVPAVRAVAARAYAYQVVAADADGDGLAFALTRAPAGMAVDAAGLVRWTPALAALGDHPVQVQVSDGRGGVTWQAFTLRVVLPGATNAAPIIGSAAPLSAKVGRGYRYGVLASDPDGDPLTFTLVDGPAGMALHPQTGHLEWTPAASGAVDVRLTVSDGELATEQAWSLTVVAAGAPLTAQLQVAPDLVSVDEPVTVELVVDNASGQVETTLALDGAPVLLDGHGRASVRSAVLGLHELTATVRDGVDEATAAGSFTVLDDSGGGPTVSIAAPADADVVTAPTEVTGAVADDDVAGWRLQLIDHDGNPPVTLASGTGAVDGALGTLDPTRLPNGLYTLTLRAWNHAGQEGKTALQVVVEGDMKIGHFALAFEDATVPLGGIPITVTRAYDTRRARQALDFGHGWSIDYQNVRVHESRTVGTRWELTYYSTGLFGNWCVEPVGKPVVTVVLPDGKVEKFKPVAVPACNFLVPITDVELGFEPLPGTHSRLEQLDHATVRLASGDLMDLAADELGAADPTLYRLTMKDGTAYELDQELGMRRVTDLDGNSVVFGPNGIEHSSGVAVSFVRDGEGRITQLRLPDGGTLRYDYDNAGDLMQVVDELGRTTRYGYLASAAFPHHLRDIVDARGVRVARSEYDASGRLVAHIDADGHRTELATDLAARVHTVRDALGQVSTLTFDDRGNVTREENPLGEVTLHTYDAVGNELSRTDGEGLVTRWTYDAFDNQTSQTDALGQITRWTYDTRGQVVSQTEPDGTVSMANQYHWARGHLQQTTDAVGNTTSFGYGPTGELTVLRRPLGVVTVYEYDHRGFKTREVAPNGAVVTYTNDDAGRVLSETRTATDAAGVEQVAVTTYTYDAAGQRLTTTDPLGRVTRTEYDAAGLVAAEIDAGGQRTEYEYDLAGRLTLTRYTDGSTEQQEYDALGRQVAAVDRAGRRTALTYDAAGRLVRTRFADGSEVQTTYDLAGRVATQVDARGGVVRFGYDAAGRRVTAADPLGHVTTTTYTPTGRRASVQDPLGRTTSYLYDAAGKLTATVHPDALAGRTQQAYDALGRISSRTDEMGRVTSYEYAVTGQLTAVVDAAGGRTEYTYDQRGNKVAQTDALGRVTRFEYDGLGQETARVLPGGQRSTREYDAEGRLAREVDENGAATEYEYDSDGRLTEVLYADGLRATTTYTPTGQVATVTDREGGVTRREYDAVDRLVRVTYPDGVRLDYTYDASGNRTSVTTTTAAGARTVSYAYDAASRLTTVDDGAGAMTYRYNAAGEVVELTRPNGVRTEYAYNVRSWPRLLIERAANGNEVNRITYTADRSGLRTGVSEQGPGTLANRTLSYQYDALLRLQRETLVDGQGQRVTQWSYDAVGNRLSQTQTRGTSTTTVASTYDPNDRLQREDGTDGTLVTYAYDPAGQLLERTEATAGTTSTTTYTYDAAHRLAGAITPAGAVAYTYDADGIRQSETIGGVTTRFVVDPTQPYPQVIAELGGAAGPAAETHYALGLGGETRLTRLQAGATTYLHTDALGSLRLTTTATGTVAERWAYHPFGSVDAHVNATTGQPLPNSGPGAHSFLFAGEQYNPALDLYYLRARHYAPTSGRFTQADTYRGSPSDPPSLHRYAYAHNNPLTNRDPSGYITLAEQAAVLRNQIRPIVRNMSRVVRAYRKVQSIADMLQALSTLVDLANGNIATTLMNSLSHDAGGFASSRSAIKKFDVNDVVNSLSMNMGRVIGDGLMPWASGIMKHRAKGRRITDGCGSIATARSRVIPAA